MVLVRVRVVSNALKGFKYVRSDVSIRWNKEACGEFSTMVPLVLGRWLLCIFAVESLNAVSERT